MKSRYLLFLKKYDYSIYEWCPQNNTRNILRMIQDGWPTGTIYTYYQCICKTGDFWNLFLNIVKYILFMENSR